MNELVEMLAEAMRRPVDGDEMHQFPPYRNYARRALAALHSRGLAIVPVEPSERMLEAGAYNEWENHDESSASIVWRLMLSASPKVTR